MRINEYLSVVSERTTSERLRYQNPMSSFGRCLGGAVEHSYMRISESLSVFLGVQHLSVLQYPSPMSGFGYCLGSTVSTRNRVHLFKQLLAEMTIAGGGVNSGRGSYFPYHTFPVVASQTLRTLYPTVVYSNTVYNTQIDPLGKHNSSYSVRSFPVKLLRSLLFHQSFSYHSTFNHHNVQSTPPRHTSPTSPPHPTSCPYAPSSTPSCGALLPPSSV